MSTPGSRGPYAEWLVWRDEMLAQLKGWVVATFDDRVH
jgi:hypothetical protein